MKQKSVICAIVKDEQRFIREWVEHYLRIGFDRIYVFEDFGSRSHEKEISDYIGSGYVVLTPLATSGVIPHYKKGTRVQAELYSRFLEKCRREQLADWIGFFDVDEFMMFEEGWNLERLEEAFADKGGVLLSWMLYGADGHMKRPRGGVVESYRNHLPPGTRLDTSSDHWNVKSLVNVSRCNGKKSIHVFNGCVFTSRQPLGQGKDHRMTYGKAWLNHYYTKSWEDYLDRIFSRGNMQNNYRCLDKFFRCSPEFRNRRKEMIFAQRHRHCASTMWISHEFKLISGGNTARIEELQKKHIQNHTRT